MLQWNPKIAYRQWKQKGKSLLQNELTFLYVSWKFCFLIQTRSCLGNDNPPILSESPIITNSTPCHRYSGKIYSALYRRQSRTHLIFFTVIVGETKLIFTSKVQRPSEKWWYFFLHPGSWLTRGWGIGVGCSWGLFQLIHFQLGHTNNYGIAQAMTGFPSGLQHILMAKKSELKLGRWGRGRSS